MAKAHIKLISGAVVDIEGTPTEITELLRYFDSGESKDKGSEGARPEVTRTARRARAPETEGTPDLTSIVNLTKECSEYEAIEAHVLDAPAVIPRVLLPLYVVFSHQGNKVWLTTGEIARITRELGAPVVQPNVSRALVSSAARYVVGDRVRAPGHAVRYKLSRRGLLYFRSLIGVPAGEDKS
jgi:hypothetical protein